MKTIQSFIPLVTVTLFLGATATSNAAITIHTGGGGTLTAGAQDSILTDGIGFFRTGDGSQPGNQKDYDFTVLSSYDAFTASKVVVTLSTEIGGGDTFPSSITFGGTALTQAAFAENGIQKSAIYYLDASSVGGGVFGTGDLALNNGGTGSNDFGMSWVFLSGTADGVSAFGQSATASVSLTTVVDNSFVIATHVNNNSGSMDADLTQIFSGDSGSAGGSSGYTTVLTAGPQTYDFTGATRPATTAVAFAPDVIPEPSSAALLGLAGLGLILRRRR